MEEKTNKDQPQTFRDQFLQLYANLMKLIKSINKFYKNCKEREIEFSLKEFNDCLCELNNKINDFISAIDIIDNNKEQSSNNDFKLDNSENHMLNLEHLYSNDSNNKNNSNSKSIIKIDDYPFNIAELELNNFKYILNSHNNIINSDIYSIEINKENEIHLFYFINYNINKELNYISMIEHEINSSFTENNSFTENFMNTETMIDSYEKFKENENNLNSIQYINIHKKNLDLSKFINNNMDNLLVLHLESSDIEDISDLKYCCFPALRKLYLDNNKINNKCIEIFNDMRMRIPKLRYLSLINNKITTIKIFDILKIFNSVKYFYIGNNRFDENEIKSYNGPNIDSTKDLEVINLNSNFTKETNFFINKINLNNLMCFYIENNELNSLKFIETFDFKLKTLNLTNNYLTDIKELSFIKNKKRMEHITLKGNKISNLSYNAIGLLSQFTELSEINLELNPIKYNECKIIIEEIKKKNKDKQFEIKI